MAVRTRRRLVQIFVSLPVILIVTALLYMGGMKVLEERPRSFWAAVAWAGETITTTGYGFDTTWEHPAMVAFVVLVQFFGVFLVYMLVPLLLLPYLEERFEQRLPRQLSEPVEGHVVIYLWGPAVETLLEELVDADVPVVILETDEALARDVTELCQDQKKRYRDVHLLHDRDVDDLLRGARLGEARALITNGSDEENATASLVAAELDFEGEILSLVEEPYHRHPLKSAGADAVFTPRHVLGAALAARASHRIQPRVGGIQQLGRNLRVGEVRIDPDSFLAGKTLRDTHLGAKTGAQVIGQWVEGELDTHPTPEMRLEPRGIVLAVGHPQSLETLSELATGERAIPADGHFVIAGYGEVGRKVAQLLRDVGESVRVADADPEIGADVVGDIADPETICQLDLENSRGVILALDSDGATLFATLIIRAEAPNLPIIARVNRAANIDRLHRAGADFVLSVSQVAAQILAHRLLRRDSLALGTELQILKTDADELVDRHPSTLEIRERTGCSVVAVERDDEVITAFDREFSFQHGDQVYVCGHRSDTERFADLYT